MGRGKHGVAENRTQATYTALDAAGQRGGGLPGRRGAHLGGGKGRHQSLGHRSSSCHSRPDQDSRHGDSSFSSSHDIPSKYTKELLTRAGIAESKTAPTPMVVHPPSTLDIHIQYVVNRVSQSMHAPTEQNFQELKWILRYLKVSSSRGLLFQKGNLELSIYSDSNWANDKAGLRSTTGYILFLGPNLISWRLEFPKLCGFIILEMLLVFLLFGQRFTVTTSTPCHIWDSYTRFGCH
uniref:Reverse transcriptase Ty1/copia-type domain-containing protein n=1 Tax=Solanum lycopersicum TaxID=4081 RepID=A0A3Q7HD32_SOLLC